ncbi:MAG: tRNA lysidine(34) synthetase TilS [Bacteroidia bacterium]|nr:tRNA lysidine(34) synthetase TilS [Bacteroidia bacterium]
MDFLLKKVQDNVFQTFSNPQKLHFLLAISGGIDSMVLLDIYAKLNLSFHIAHANFQLRGQDSLQDEIFVLEQGKKYVESSKIHIQRFEIHKIHQNLKDTSVQMLARQLRYQWFYELLNTYNLDYIVTAHHADDNIETFFLKLFRKSPQGLSGMGMLSEKRIFRPLLNVFKIEIQTYAVQNIIFYREDSSNLKDDYLRNHIRHHLIPYIEKHYPTSKNAILAILEYQKQINLMANTYFMDIWQKTVTQHLDCYTIDLIALQNYPTHIHSALPWYYADKLRIGTNQFEQFKYLFQPNTTTGKEMRTSTHKAVRYKNLIQIFPINTDGAEELKIYTVAQNLDILTQIDKNYILIASDYIATCKDNLFKQVTRIQRWRAGMKILHQGKMKNIADLLPKYNITPYQKEYLYVATAPTKIEKTYSHLLNNFSNNALSISFEVLFVFFCPRNVLLQLK